MTTKINFFTFIIIIICPFIVKAQNDKLGDSLIIKNNPKNLNNEQLAVITNRLCYDILDAQSKGLEMPKWERTMRSELGFSGKDSEFPEFFNDFLNTYKNKIICPELKITTTIYPPQHFFKRVLALDLDEAYEVYFYDFDNGEVDFNAYEIVNGKKETVLDWIEKWIELGRGDPSTLRDVAISLEEEFGAKYGKDLTNKESTKH